MEGLGHAAGGPIGPIGPIRWLPSSCLGAQGFPKLRFGTGARREPRSPCVPKRELRNEGSRDHEGSPPQASRKLVGDSGCESATRTPLREGRGSRSEGRVEEGREDGRTGGVAKVFGGGLGEPVLLKKGSPREKRREEKRGESRTRTMGGLWAPTFPANLR